MTPKVARAQDISVERLLPNAWNPNTMSEEAFTRLVKEIETIRELSLRQIPRTSNNQLRPQICPQRVYFAISHITSICRQVNHNNGVYLPIKIKPVLLNRQKTSTAIGKVPAGAITAKLLNFMESAQSFLNLQFRRTHQERQERLVPDPCESSVLPPRLLLSHVRVHCQKKDLRMSSLLTASPQLQLWPSCFHALRSRRVPPFSP